MSLLGKKKTQCVLEDIFKIVEDCITAKYYRYKLAIFDLWVLFTLSVFISVISSYILFREHLV